MYSWNQYFTDFPAARRLRNTASAAAATAAAGLAYRKLSAMAGSNKRRLPPTPESMPKKKQATPRNVRVTIKADKNGISFFFLKRCLLLLVKINPVI